MSVFTENLKRLMRDKGITFAELSRELQIGKNNMKIWESDDTKIPYGKTLHKLSDYFEVTVDELLGAEKEKAPTPPADGANAKYHELMSLLDQMDDKSLSRFIELAHLASLPDEEFDRAIAILRLAIPGEQS